MKILITLLKPFSFAPAILMMCVIYSFSAQTGEVSGALSYKVSYQIVETKNEILATGKSPDQLSQEASHIEFYVRKAAHMTEYCLLSISISFPLYVYGVRGIWLMLLAGFVCVGFAGLDEYHQSFLADTRAQAAGQYAQLSELLSGAAETLEAQPTAAETLLTYRVGAALRPKEGENVSGDSVTHFETEDGRLCLLLSDGMGCGEEARRESALAVRLLERFLRAGVETSGALKTLNSALTLRAEVSESFTTIDLLTLSLRDGAAEVYKYGAAPSYVKRGARVRRITGSCLPAGLQSADTRPETTGFTLEKGSFFVMLSDGVADVNDDGWLMALLEKFQGDDPQALASAILAAGRERRGGDDDCAVLALYRDKDGGAVEV